MVVPVPVTEYQMPGESTPVPQKSASGSGFEKTASVWRDNPDLIRKNYLYDAQAGVAGGVYLWKEKAHAQKWHGAEFRDRVKKLYGAEPSSQFYETPIVVDNLTGVIVK